MKNLSTIRVLLALCLASCAANAANTLTNGLVVHLTFDNTMNDSSGRGNNATYNSQWGLLTNPVAPTYVTGQIGQAWQFTTMYDGSIIEMATLGYPPDLQFGTNNWSVSFWINVAAANLYNNPPIFSNKNWWTKHNPGWNIDIQPYGGIRVQMTDTNDSAEAGAAFPGTVDDGTWHLVTVVDTVGHSVDYYLDGALNTSVTNPITASMDTSNFLNGVGQPMAVNLGQAGTGAYNGSSANPPPATANGDTGIVDGQMDDVGIWRRTLSATEVEEIYLAGLQHRSLSQGYVPPPPAELPITNGLVTHLTFDNTMNDSSGRTNNAAYNSQWGLLTNPVAPTYVTGQIGQAFQFTTEKDASEIEMATLGYPSDLQFGTNSWSVSFWVNVPAGNTYNNPPLIGNKNWWTLGNPGWMIAVQPPGGFRVQITDTNDSVEVDALPSGTIVDGTWHQVAVVVNTVTHTLDCYEDGVLTVSVPDTITLSTDTESFLNGVGQPMAINIGQAGTGAYNGSSANPPPATAGGDTGIVDGKIDDVGFWNRALTGNDIAGIYNTGLAHEDLSQVVASLGQIQATVSSGTITLTWSAAANVSLQESTDLTNPSSWTTVNRTLGASSYSEPVGAGAATTFYRLSTQ